jgi:hypothetical protein
MPIKEDIQEKINQKLKEKILSQEEKKDIYSHKFQKIEEEIKENLKNRQTDNALYNITI